MDIYGRYLEGVKELLQIVTPNDDYLPILTLQGRLAQAIADQRQFGTTDNTRAEIAKVITELERICLLHCNQSFYNLCGLNDLAMPTIPKIRHNLPQIDFGSFVGRQAEIDQIHRILRPYPYSQHALITIDGIGGIGKSALALDIAYYYLNDYNLLPKEERFDALIWTSAKKSILTADGIKSRYQVLQTIPEIFTAIAVTLNRGGILKSQLEEQIELVRNALTQSRILLILDNLETVDDEDVLSFLRELPAPTKAIVTTRHRIDVAYPIRLREMLWDEGYLLINNECSKKGANLSDDQKKQLYIRAGGVPLAMVWSIAQIGYGFSPDSVILRLASHDSDIARFCFEEIIQGLQKHPPYALLLALSLFSKDADRETLGRVVDYDNLLRDDGLAELEKLSLVNKTHSRFSLLPLTKSYVSQKLKSDPERHKTYWRRLADYYIEWSEREDRMVAGHSVESFDEWRYERENFLTVTDQAYAMDEFRTFLQLILTASYFQFTLGFWEERNRYAHMGIEIAQNIGDMNSYARLVHDIAYVYYMEDDYENATKLSTESQRIFRTLDDSWHLGSSLRLSGMIEFKLGNIEKAKQDLNEDLNIMTQIGSDRGRVIACNGLAEIAIAEKDFDLAYKLILDSIKVSENEAHFDSLSHCYAILGSLFEAQEKLDLAEENYRASLGYEERMQRPPYQAMRMLSLASVLLKVDRTFEAHELAEHACGLAEQVGMPSEINKAHLILDLIHSS